jgi:aspartate kinase
MPLIVHKYGGTSVGTVERIKAVAERIARNRRAGDSIVAVVSAMGDTTDDLLKLASAITAHPEQRELDQLLATGEEQAMALVAMALHAIDVPAVSLTGPQAGIRTIGPYGKAKIADIAPTRIRESLDAGQVVIVAGFQGLNEDDDVTTLGRGGSDTTAVALAAALKADRCIIYTDVDGIFTADPRVVPNARKLDLISYDDMLELSWRGAKMQPRSVEIAKMYGVLVEVASSFADKPGTLITEVQAVENRQTISGIAYERGVAKITVAGVPAGTDSIAAVFGPLADAEVSVDVIVVESGSAGAARSDISFTVSEKDLPAAESIVVEAARALGGTVRSANGHGKVSVVGTGMFNRPGYAARMFRTLAALGVAVDMVTTSEIQVTCVIPRDDIDRSVRGLHDAFGLDR